MGASFGYLPVPKPVDADVQPKAIQRGTECPLLGPCGLQIQGLPLAARLLETGD